MRTAVTMAATRPARHATPVSPDPEPAGPGDGYAVAVEYLTKRFGDRVAFDDVSFEVGYGEVFGFLGPNGAGKTTTVCTLGTLLTSTSGSATVAGIASLPPLAIVALITFNVIPVSAGLTLGLATALLAVDGLGWRAVAAMFDRERLVTGGRT